MARDRDKHEPRTPPPGVAAQIARPQADSPWEQQHTGVTPVHGVPVRSEDSVQTLVRRSAQTKNMVIDVQAEVTALGNRVSNLETKVTSVADAVDEQGKQNAQIIGITGAALEILKHRETVTTTTQLAQVEVTTKRALTENELARERGLVQIADDKETRAIKREERRQLFKRFVMPILVAVAVYASLKLAGG